jgi:hypothetical protein
MKLKIGLATLIAVISVTGVAVAATGGIHVFGIDLPVATPASSSALKLDSNLAKIDCWAVTGGSHGASCATAADAPGIPGLPGIPQLPSLPSLPLPGLPGVPSLPNLPGLPGLPSACTAGLPVGIPAPAGTLKVATDTLKTVENTVKGALPNLSVPNVPLPVQLPVSLPSISGVPSPTSLLSRELGCATSSTAPASVPEMCKVTAPGLPVALPVGGDLVGTIAKDVKNLTGQSIAAAGGAAGLNCSLDPSKIQAPSVAAPSLPKVNLPKLPALPGVPSVGLPTLPGLPGLSGLPVGDPLGTVTGVLDDVLSIVGAPSCSASGSASGGGLLSGVLGSLSASATC